MNQAFEFKSSRPTALFLSGPSICSSMAFPSRDTLDAGLEHAPKIPVTWEARAETLHIQGQPSLQCKTLYQSGGKKWGDGLGM